MDVGGGGEWRRWVAEVVIVLVIVVIVVVVVVLASDGLLEENTSAPVKNTSAPVRRDLPTGEADKKQKKTLTTAWQQPAGNNLK